MLLGPVFRVELMTTARRPRYYVVRFLYGLIILAQVYLTYQANSWRLGSGELGLKEMADFGQGLFTTFAVVQGIVILLLTPALVGGSIADERQRKTLHYLLTSDLSSGEIVLGKLAARLLQVVVLVALGLPVVSLLGLFGGIDFQILWMTYGGTLTTAWFLATASILVSVFARRPREAILLIYVLELAWLAVPPLLMELMPQWVEPWPTIAEWVNPALAYVVATSPIGLPRMMVGMTSLLPSLLWMMGLQAACGVAFVALAATRLRPVFRNDGGRSKLTRGLARVVRKRSWFPRRPCGDDAMLWKEMRVARTGGLTKAVLTILGVAMVGIVGYSAFGFVVSAFDEFWRNGYFGQSPARRDFNVFLRGISVGAYVLWMLGVAASAAGGFSGEREEDQWISLVSTPLSGLEIVRAKLIGPIWGLRVVAYLIAALWAVGLVVGSLHPLGLLAGLVEWTVFTWFLASLGAWFSLRSKNSTRALASTMATLLFVNGGYLFCCIPFRPDSTLAAAGSTPFILALSLMSEEDLASFGGDRHIVEYVMTCVIGVAAYAVAALGLTAEMLTNFDRVVDRPDRSRQPPKPAKVAAKEARPGDGLA